jgi:hypothetical protein
MKLILLHPAHGVLAWITVFAVCVACLSSNADARTLTAAEWNAIRRVIAEQRTALIEGNADRAFGYATDRTKQQFGDAETFLSMVRTGYAALLTARYVEFLEGAVIEGVVVQPLRLIGADNTVLVALYTLEKQKNGRWRIAGCRIAPSTVQAA